MYQGRHSREAVLLERQRARKKKRIAVLASVALVGVMLVGGTLAWLIAGTENVNNEFVPSEVTCEVSETFKDNIKTDVTVANTGNTDAYIRANVVVNWVNPDTSEVLGIAPKEGVDYQIAFNSPENETNWIEGEDGYWYWPLVVPVGESTEILVAQCEPLKDAPEDDYVLSVDIVCSAIQAEGLNSNNQPVVVEAWQPAVTGVTDGSLIVDQAQ